MADGLDGAIVEDRFQPVAERERKPRGERLAPFGAGAEGIGDLDAVLEVQKPLGVRGHGHAETDQCDACLCHGAAISSAEMGRNARSRRIAIVHQNPIPREQLLAAPDQAAFEPERSDGDHAPVGDEPG